MPKCDICETEGHYKVRVEQGVCFCSDCLRTIYVPREAPNLHVKVRLGDMPKVSQARINELDRRVVLPYTVPGKDYIVGRRNNDGSISEKAADLTP